MKGLSLIALFLCSISAFAIPNAELLTNLKSRLHDMPAGGKLIKSFSENSQSYIYDQALAIITFTREKDLVNARQLLMALQNLQLNDGSLYFSYYLDGQSPYPAEGDRRLTGAMAWVALAATHYQSQFRTKEFLAFNFRLLKYLQNELRPIHINGKNYEAMRFGPADLPTTPWAENDTAALEHNLDAYAAFSHFLKLNPVKKWQPHVEKLRSFIVSLWDENRSHFWSGANFSRGLINKQELYLDNQTWTLLALDRSTLKELNMQEALKLNCEALMVEHEGIVGFMDSKPTRRASGHNFVWSEGTAGQVLAMRKADQLNPERTTCKNKDSKHFLANIKKMRTEDGGIAYATTTSNPDFTTSSSVAGTAWLYFASNDFNPFHVD